MHQSQITTEIANDQALAQRIAGVIFKASSTASLSRTERALLDRLDYSVIAQQVAGNPTILASVTSQLGESSDVASAIQQALGDSDLEYVVLTELTFLQA